MQLFEGEWPVSNLHPLLLFDIERSIPGLWSFNHNIFENEKQIYPNKSLAYAQELATINYWYSREVTTNGQRYYWVKKYSLDVTLKLNKLRVTVLKLH